jgi:N-acetylneuraminic acid mutarotase
MSACGGGGGGGGGSSTGSASLTLGGTVAHLVGGSSVALQNIGGDTVTVAANGSFTFPKSYAGGTPFDVTVSTQPSNATCTVAGGNGTITNADVTSIMVSCAPKAYSITGSLTGLLTGRNLVLQDNGGDDTTVSADSGFLFSTPVASGAHYSVTIRTQPAGQNCAVTNGNGTVANADVTSVTINCSDDTYNVGVTVSGLIADGLVLQDNGGDNLAVSSNGRFNFNTPVASGSAYAVSILSQPVGETCAIANAGGTIVSSNIGNVSVACVPNTYQISGSVSGLLSGASLILQNDGGDSTPVSANGAFSFAGAVASGNNYAVTVATQPAAQNCAISNGSGIVVASSLSSVTVICSNNTYNVAATVSGLNAGSLALQDNGGDALSILGDGLFNFNMPLASNANYNITILTQPAGENCTLSNGSGTIGSSNVTSVAVACVTTAFSVGGSVSGLGAATITLQNNGADNLLISANGGFTFATPIASGATYAVTILTQPPGQQCTVNDGSGIVGAAAVTTIDVSCPNVWTWIGGPNTSAGAGVYGTLGVAAAGNTPGARTGASSWTDSAGNLWLFGGQGDAGVGAAGFLNDLWKFNPAAGTWTWIAGSNTVNAAGVYGTQGVAATGNVPGARQSAATWTDSAGNLWLFGGDAGTTGTSAVAFNDLWQFNPTAGTWTWISGSNAAGAGGVYGTLGTAAASNVPGARSAANYWSDSSGNFWLLGGGGYATAGANGCLGDLWTFSPTNNVWTWVGGPNTINAAAVYGTQGSAASGNTPGGRCNAASWIDATGNLWLFGGYAAYSAKNDGVLNDLWTYNAATGAWTWISGSNTLNAAGIYGALGVAAAGNSPGARESASTWTDASGNLWLFGGYGDPAGSYGPYNDVWTFNASAGTWTWMAGSNRLGASGIYGTLGVAAPGNIAGARSGATPWTDVQGNFWLFGGNAYDSAGNYGYLNDLWEFVP